MIPSLFLALRLFRFPLLLIALIYTLVIITIMVLFTLKDSYKYQLQLQFVSKQPHISVSFVNDNVTLNEKYRNSYKKKLAKISPEIETIASFSKGKSFFTAQGVKEGGDAYFTGYVTLIGIDTHTMVYDFYASNLVGRPPFEIPYTPLEFLYRWQDKSEDQKPFAVFNQTLFNSFFPVIASIDSFGFKNSTLHTVRLGAVFEDFDQASILYSSLMSINTMLERPKNHLDGFYINVRAYDAIEDVKVAVQKALKDEAVTVSSWLESRQKQFELFMLYEALSWVVALLLLVLALLLMFLFLYYVIVKKSYQLSVLFTLGFSLEKVLKVMILTLMLLGSLVALFIGFYLAGVLSFSLGLPQDHIGLSNNLLYLASLTLLTMFTASKLISSAYSMKLKSLI